MVGGALAVAPDPVSQGARAVGRGRELAQAARLDGGQGRFRSPRDTGPDIVQCPGLDHLRHPQVAAGIQGLPVRLDHLTRP